jgi:hypothetical protein
MDPCSWMGKGWNRGVTQRRDPCVHPHLLGVTLCEHLVMPWRTNSGKTNRPGIIKGTDVRKLKLIALDSTTYERWAFYLDKLRDSWIFWILNLFRYFRLCAERRHKVSSKKLPSGSKLERVDEFCVRHKLVILIQTKFLQMAALPVVASSWTSDC